MNLQQNKSLVRITALAAFGLALANAQTQDISGNGMLKGSFRFRHVAVLNIDSNNNPSEIAATYGSITFDGAGKYTVAGTSVDNTVSNGAPQALNTTGTYAIGSNGIGYIANPLFPTDGNDYIYGAVAQGVFIGSSTEAEQELLPLNDIFIAIPTGTAPTNGSFNSAYQTGLLDFAGANTAAIKNALFKLSANGSGAFGAISLTGQASNQTSTPNLTQSVSGATYNFASDGTATLTIPLPSGVTSTNALFTGTKTMFVSADGNFILGWTAAGYDIFFGVKALSITGSNSITKGLYFISGLEDIPVSSNSGVDSFYGSISNSGNSAGDGIEHARLNYPAFSAYDFGTDNQISLNSDGTTTSPDFNGYNYIFGDGGLAFVGIGTGGDYALIAGVHAPTFSGSGVYINPIGVVNAASFQPITASLSPGELITIFGTGLASVTMTTQGGQKFPTQLGGVSVTIDSTPCAIYYVSPTQLAVVVPYELSSNGTPYANIQVSNNGTLSNVVQLYWQDASPGIFSTTSNGLGLAAAVHAVTGQLVTTSNPAQPGEYVSLYLTGLGTVTPSVSDGALGPTNPLSTADENTNGNLFVYFNDYGPNGTLGNVGTIQFAGLAPGLAGLYQINVLVPKTGLTSGDPVEIEIQTDFADINQIYIPYGSASGATSFRPAHVTGLRSQGRKPVNAQRSRQP
jgi:uncharacterized protein (TIGR03437 family)